MQVDDRQGGLTGVNAEHGHDKPSHTVVSRASTSSKYVRDLDWWEGRLVGARRRREVDRMGYSVPKRRAWQIRSALACGPSCQPRGDWCCSRPFVTTKDTRPPATVLSVCTISHFLNRQQRA